MKLERDNQSLRDALSEAVESLKIANARFAKENEALQDALRDTQMQLELTQSVAERDKQNMIKVDGYVNVFFF